MRNAELTLARNVGFRMSATHKKPKAFPTPNSSLLTKKRPAATAKNIVFFCPLSVSAQTTTPNSSLLTPNFFEEKLTFPDGTTDY